jgi:CrcB protein
MLRNFLLVGLGGGVGCMARYGTALLINRWWQQQFPLATFLINIAGCFIIGVLYGLGQRHDWWKDAMWLLLASGFCGGFTTFSTFALEGNLLLAGKFNLLMAVYAVSSVFAGLLLCRAGIWLSN